MGSVVRSCQRQQYNIHLDNEGSTVGSDGDDDGFSAINVGSARTASTRQRTTQGSAGWSDDLPNDLQAQTATEGQDPTDLVGLRMMAAERDRRAQRNSAAAEADREHLRDLYKYHGFNSKSNPDLPRSLAHCCCSWSASALRSLKTTAHLNGRVGTVTKRTRPRGASVCQACCGRWRASTDDGLQAGQPQDALRRSLSPKRAATCGPVYAYVSFMSS